MRRILCLLLSALTLFACLSFTVLAAEEATPDIMDDLSKLTVDGEAFSVDKHLPEVSEKKGLGIITVVENGFNVSTNHLGYNLFIYVYNPSGQVFTDDEFNSVQVGFNDDCNLYRFVGVEILLRSSDQRFLKLAVRNTTTYGSISRCYTEQENPGMRVYNFVGLRFLVNGEKKSFTVNRAFFFSGTGTNSKCEAKDMDSLKVELHDTNWISPNAGARVDGKPVSIYDHYEIHSVYFKVPKTYWNKYKYLYSIYATYDAVHLTPIIMTREGDRDFSDAKGVITKNAILEGTMLTVDGEPDVYDLFWSHHMNNVNYKFVYTENSTTRRLAMNGMNTETVGTVYDSLAYYFANLPDDFDYDDGTMVAKAVVNSEELRNYFYERYNDRNYDNSKLYSEYISNQIIGIDATQFNADGIYQMGGTYQEILSTKSDLEQWWTRLWVQNNGYLFEDFVTEANYIDVISRPQDYVNISESDYAKKSNELFISEADIDAFSKVCAEAVEEDCYVVLLRLGLKDYSCHVVEDVAEQALGFGTNVALAVDKWAYLNISVAQLVFSSDGQLYNVPVVSNVKDSFGDLNGYGDGAINNPGEFFGNVGFLLNRSLSDLFASLENLLGVIGIAILAIVIVWIVMKFKPVKVKHVYPDDREKRKRRKRE